MCFGSSKNTPHEEQARPASGKGTHGPEAKASVPAQYHHNHQQPQFQQQQAPMSNDYAPPPGPPPASHDYAPPSGPPPSQRPPVSSAADEFAPPPGPPPSHRPSAGNEFAQPPGPPPSHRANDEFAPPPGPPPSQRPAKHDDFAPPPGPPPSQSHNDMSYVAPPPGPPPALADPKSKHDWETLVPDTTLFPPPPSFFTGWDRSPTNNATEAEAEAGEQWCAQHPLTAPITLDPAALAALRAHNPRLMQPDGFQGSLVCTGSGVWKVETGKRAPDSTIIAYPPLYTVTTHSPLSPSHPNLKTIYYEIHLSPSTPIPRRHDEGVCLAMGFTALPYPSFRLPGWHRGSLAVHGDDGHKYINDRWGGRDFTSPFRKAGEKLGVGMTFSANSGRIEASVFFTRDGREVGRWDVHEEGDAEQDLPVTGLEGYHDLSCAIGTCGEVRFEVVLEPGRWAYRPAGY